MSDPTRKEKFKEYREWGTFVLSFIQVVAIPVLLYMIYLVLQNQRLQIEKDVRDNYVSKMDFRREGEATSATVKEISMKVDTMLINQAVATAAISDLKDQVRKNHAP